MVKNCAKVEILCVFVGIVSEILWRKEFFVTLRCTWWGEGSSCRKIKIGTIKKVLKSLDT